MFRSESTKIATIGCEKPDGEAEREHTKEVIMPHLNGMGVPGDCETNGVNMFRVYSPRILYDSDGIATPGYAKPGGEVGR